MKLFVTKYENEKRETSVEDVNIAENFGEAMQLVTLYPEIEYQTFHGFGGAITEAAGYAWSKLTPENKEKVIEGYFGAEGNNYSFVRTHIDSCDFSIEHYAALSDKDDREMNSFALDREELYILPMLRAAQSKREDTIDLMLTPWSPPAFMKTNNDRNHGGKLLPEYADFWAAYICRYIKEYEKKGHKVNRITIQNEPEAVQTWDSCIFSGEEEKVFLRDHLYPKMVEEGLSHIKINIWDHNKEKMYERAKETIDKDTDSMIDGVAFHWYTGDHFEAVALTRDAFPGKELIFTEGCVEYSRFDADELRNARMYAHDIIGNLNAGMTGFIDWNICLDEKGGPNHVSNFCDAPIMCDTNTGEYVEKLSFHYIRHFSKHIKPGAKRIAFTKYTDKLDMTAFKNVDGSIVVVMLNHNDYDMRVNLKMNGKGASLDIKKMTIATAVFE